MPFTFFHPYMPVVFDAQLNAGLFRQGDGIRFCQSIDIDENLKFNNLACEDGALYRFVKENNSPFYIDRLQGGCFFEGYDYDMKLVSRYREICGDNFYGFQMHEWMSNVLSDTYKLVGGNCSEPWTEENIIATIKRDFPYPHVFTEAMSAREYAETGHLTDIDAYKTAMINLFNKRMSYTDGQLLPCDSALLGYSLEFRNGALRIMPEIGQQTHNTAVQVAYARGMAKAYKRSFGTYYEPWGGTPFSACNYHKEGKNEWNIDSASFPFKTAGGNGGSSRSLQKRLFLYSYFAGAEFISEEWGLCNTFYDWNDFELTPYGQTKKDFLDFIGNYNNIGKPITPIAAVIPKDIIALDDIDCTDNTHLSYQIGGTAAERINGMRKGLRILFGGGETYGNENGCLVNRILPDAIDIVNEDVYDDSKYEYAVNLTGNAEFEKKHRCCDVHDVGQMLDDLLPCRVSGGLHHIVTKNDKGEYYLAIFNNTGIVRSVDEGEYGLKEAEITARIATKDNRPLCVLLSACPTEKQGDEYIVTIPAGGVFIGRF